MTIRTKIVRAIEFGNVVSSLGKLLSISVTCRALNALDLNSLGRHRHFVLKDEKKICWDLMAMDGRQKAIVCDDHPKRVEDRPRRSSAIREKKWFPSAPDPCLLV